MVSNLKKYFRWYILLVFITLGFILWNIVLSKSKEGILTFTVLDVGQGDSIYIESPTGMQILVDGGPGNTISREINSVMPWYDRSLDMIVVTNPDADHYEGFIKLLNKYKVGSVLESGTTNSYEGFQIFEQKIIGKNVTKTLARRGQIIDIGGGAYLQVLFPDRDISGLSPNDGSIVMKLIYGDTSVLLSGDTTSRIEEYLLTLDSNLPAQAGSLRSNILKIAHHGSRTSSKMEFVERVSPAVAVISSGENNEYGHPHKETIDTLNNFKIPTLNTCNNGKIVFESDGKKFVLKNKNPKIAVVGCQL